MKSTGLVEEHKDTSQENDLIMDADDLPPGNELRPQIDSLLSRKSSPFTIRDIVNSNKEGADETDQIRRLEKRKANQDAMNESLLPGMPDVFINTLVKCDDEQHQSDCRSPGLQGNSSNLSELTRRYARLSASCPDVPAEQGDQLQEGQSRNTALQASNISTLSELTSQYARYSNSQRDSGVFSLDSSHLNSFPLEDSVTRGNADLYYKNAAMMINQDIESGRHASDETGGDSEPSRKEKCCVKLKRRTKAVLEVFHEFAKPHKKRLRLSFKRVAIYVMLPSLIMAILLYYPFGNPPTGYALIMCGDLNRLSTANRKLQTMQEYSEQVLEDLNPFSKKNTTDEQAVRPKVTAEPTQSPSSSPTLYPRKAAYTLIDKRRSNLCIDKNLSLEEASVSWWFLFIGVRQAITFCLAVLMETIVIDFLMFRTRFFPKFIGTELALAVGQSKGWPCILFFWAIFDILLLFGRGPHTRHWFFYQNFISLMNATNPSGNIPDQYVYRRIIYFAIGLSVSATLKRTLMANFVGQRVVVNYRRDLTELIKKLLIVGDLANLSKSASPRQRGTKSILFQRVGSFGRDVIGNLEDSENNREDDDETDSTTEPVDLPASLGRDIRSPTKFSGNSIFTAQFYDYLDEWEEPELQTKSQNVSTKDVLHVRRAVEFINGDYPFSPSFGSATTREECAKASQNLFDKLLKKDEHVLTFDVLGKIARHLDGTNDRKKIMELVKLFRPNRKGEITKLDFVKSIDSVYKRLRLVLANINNASQIDRAYGQITNVIFWAVSVLVGLSVFGYNVEALLITLAGLLVSFAFMISSASSKYVEGILLILIRRPYDIGDKVCFMEPNADVDDFGPPGGGWIVETVDLYTTTVRKGTTREWATFTNGSLANSRILNLKRSEKPNIYMYLKFTMNITQEQLDEFRRRIIEFIKDRPREWIKLVSLRCTHFETEQQYLKFSLIVQHRESWQSFGTIQVSKSDIYIHALHLQKELKIYYTAPKVPIHVTGVLPTPPTKDSKDSDTDENMNSNDQLFSQFSSINSPLGNESKPRVLDDPPSEAEQVEPSQMPSTSLNAGATTVIDGSLVRRKVTRSSNSGPIDSFEVGTNNQPMKVRQGLPLGVNSSTTSEPEIFDRRQVTFATEAQDDGKKNKDM